MSATSSFKSTENNHDLYRGKDCMKKFCESLREQAKKTINFKTKNIKLLTKEQEELYENGKICYIGKEKNQNKYFKDKKHCILRNYCYYTWNYSATHSICNLKYNVPKKFLQFFIMDLTIIIILS